MFYLPPSGRGIFGRLGAINMTDSSVQMAIEALERLMDEQEGQGQGKHVVVFRVFVGQRCVGGRLPFFLDTDAANNYYNDLVRKIDQEALAVDRESTSATVRLHDKHHEWNR
jgi:hypothetical protein